MKMSTKKATLIHVNEEYIDMELSSCSSSPSSSSQGREFEFQMTSSLSSEKETTTSPADDLFYKGKLLPLHLPPRLKMVQNLIHNTNTNKNNTNSTLFENVVKSYSSLEDTNFPFITSSPLVESFNISPSESCRVSSEANPDEYLFGWSSSTFSDINNAFIVGVDSGVCDFPKNSWPKKLKQMKQFLLGHQRLKSSRAYLRSIFRKSSCSDKSCASNVVGAEKKNKPRCRECQNKYIIKITNNNNSKKNKNNPFEIFDDHDDCNNNNKREILEDEFSNHRRSFSGVIQRHCGNNNKPLTWSTSSSGSSSSSSSSSFSLSSAGYYDLQIFKRSISANSELECSVEGAIAHCKNSQRLLCGSKNRRSTFCGGENNSRICSQFASKVADCGNQDMAESV